MKYKSKKEIMEANLSEWERKVILEQFEFEQNLSDIGKLILELNGVKL